MLATIAGVRNWYGVFVPVGEPPVRKLLMANHSSDGADSQLTQKRLPALAAPVLVLGTVNAQSPSESDVHSAHSSVRAAPIVPFALSAWSRNVTPSKGTGSEDSMSRSPRTRTLITEVVVLGAGTANGAATTVSTGGGVAADADVEAVPEATRANSVNTVAILPVRVRLEFVPVIMTTPSRRGGLRSAEQDRTRLTP